MSGNPVVTVLMPVFNGARHLPETLRSLQGQSFTDFEVLVIDDGSTDDSAQIAREFGDSRIRVVGNVRNLGLVESLNRGLREARGSIIARLDADDLAHPDRLGRQLEFMRGNPAVPLIGSDARLINERGQWCGRWRTGGASDLVRWDCGFRTPFAHSTAMFRRNVILDRFGGYRHQKSCEDLDLWSRVVREFPVVTLRDCLVSYRQHAGSVMAGEHAVTDQSHRQAMVEIISESLHHLAPGLPEGDARFLADVWSSRRPEADWSRYWIVWGDLRMGYLRGRSGLPGFNRVCADQTFMLVCRLSQSSRIRFLSAMFAVDCRLIPHFPWVRLMMVLLRS